MRPIQKVSVAWLMSIAFVTHIALPIHDGNSDCSVVLRFGS